MGNVKLDTELRRTMRVSGGAAEMHNETSLHLYDRMEGFLSVLSFTPVGDDADAALRAHHLASLIEGMQNDLEAGTAIDPAFVRLGWRLADELTVYLEAKSGVTMPRGRQTREMQSLLRRAG